MHLHGHLHSSREGGEDGPNFLRGLLKTARSALWLVPEVLVNIHEALRTWDDDRFVKLLPLLRLALADLTPRETDRVAKCVATMLGAESLNVATLPGYRQRRDAAGGGSQPPGPRLSGRGWTGGVL